ncbi:pyruvate kinase [Bythopirellula goksoeyrii]|uniref:Pyruvate kinase n=1 Tax=Bythopirellula goksoeyrii TaxID=1400387 RepID=A0A5B9Q6Q3_9BACT|nr:pyruvate kinase [Bythopirellula goksoeyrii]QEG34704.1 Sulfate adenylyltransferase [Bythopirellula goksoeyrii]
MATRDRVINILCTLGPSSLNRQVIERLQVRGVDLFRINLSHTPLSKVEETIRIIQDHSSTPICLDTEGAQVRTGTMEKDVVVQDRQHVRLTAETVVGTGDCLSLTPPTLFAGLRPNNLIGLDFDGVVLLVLHADETGADTVVLNGGKVGSNKAVVIDPAPKLPPLTDDDIGAVEIGRQMGVTHFALSFANTAEDVALLRKYAGPGSTIISKIESKLGVRNLDEILAESDAILIDRGDLSREVPLENIPFLQKAIIRKGNMANKPVHVATNLLESMLVNRKPTRAELNDITNTLLDGANGLVLAAETAIGKYPVGAVDMVLSMIERFRRSLDGYRIEDLLESSPLLLPSLHGRSDIEKHSVASYRPMPKELLSKLPAIEVDLETAMDIEQIAHGVYSPLNGFMTEAQLESVLNDFRLPSGDIWTMPIILQGKSQEFAAYQPGQSIRLIDHRTGESTAILHLEDKYEVDLESVASRWFGTTDKNHPGVARFMSRGVTLLGGPIEYLGPASIARSPYQLTPEQTRMLFEIKGWSKIIAFHTRNAPHRGHEYVIANACERSNADGVLIHPVIGPKKSGDFTQEAILGAYERLITARLPNSLLAAFSTYSRYCGPREAVFTALCRKNFGCTHFVLGRDHTGVGNFYAANQNKDLFDQLGDIGITPVFFDTVYYSEEKDAMVESTAPNEKHLRSISGTMIRNLLLEGQPVPDWCMREEVSNYLLELREAKRPLFVD